MLSRAKSGGRLRSARIGHAQQALRRHQEQRHDASDREGNVTIPLVFLHQIKQPNLPQQIKRRPSLESIYLGGCCDEDHVNGYGLGTD